SGPSAAPAAREGLREQGASSLTSLFVLQMEQAHSGGTASSTGSLERANCSLSVIPCTCSRGGLRHSWSRLKVDIQGPLHGECPALREPCFWDINECIEASLEKRKRVLIHCLDGYSLAPTCVIQYLMVKHNMRLMAAYEFVRARYPLNIRDRNGVWEGLSICVMLHKSLWTRITGRKPQGTPRCVSARS
uniref:protein-tyrosine-phosphatase n=1 Tax=Terrapene triunguis TaxID=2587831 RepID=A0A674J527_9SAUR